MATTVTITSTYAGEFAGKYIAAALLSGDTLGKNAITIRQNVKFKEVVKRLTPSGLIADATCAFTPTGTLLLDERILQPKELQVNLEICKDPFQSDWDAMSMGMSAFDNLPANFTEFLIAQMGLLVGEAIEKSIWQGDAGNAGEFDGFVKLLGADTTVIDIAGATVTAANVVAEIDKVVQAIPDEVYGKSDLMIYASSNIVRAYNSALGNQGYMQAFHVGDKPMNFDGLDLFYAPGLPADTMVAAQKANLWFGTGLLSDKNEVKVLDMADIDGSQNVRFIMRFTGGVQYGFGKEIVLYKKP
jgi:hypothetical protein